MFDVVVIGAGVVGGFVARELAKYKVKVCLVERRNDVAMGATRANSAIVHSGFDAKPGSLKAKLNVRGSEIMEELSRELGVKYNRCGSLVVGFNEEDKETLKELFDRGVKNGVRELFLLSREEVLELEPNIGDGVVCALYAPRGAITCPYELTVAAVGNAMDNGATLKCNFEVVGIEKSGGVYKVKSEKEEIEAKYVINCAGVYSDKIAKMVGDNSFTVTPRIGEYMLLDKECGQHVTRTVFRCPSGMGKGILVSPTVDGNLILGPTAENVTDKDRQATSQEGFSKIRKQANEQVKGIDFSKVITSFSGIRSIGSTGDFIINSPVENFFNVAGIESPGLSSAPAIAEYTVELLKKSGAKLERNESFSGTRRPAHYFKELSNEEKNEIIKEHPEYAHVICRCETVTEGEILEAIRTNPRPTDIDGVKRRTRATMGRCQGGFCTPYIIELLAKELGVEYDEVTKFGGGSYINRGRTKGGR